jgi:hypothetical protein
VQLYFFRSGSNKNLFALSRDAGDGLLPAESAPWDLVGKLFLYAGCGSSFEAARVRMILTAVEVDGFYIGEGTDG